MNAILGKLSRQFAFIIHKLGIKINGLIIALMLILSDHSVYKKNIFLQKSPLGR